MLQRYSRLELAIRIQPVSSQRLCPQIQRQRILKLICSCEHQSISMTKQEKNRLSAVLRATEYLFLENIALKLVLEHREVANWQRLLERLVTDKEMLAGVRLKFRDVYQEIEASTDPSAALEALLGELPAPKKTH